jgi:hypothetical protein
VQPQVPGQQPRKRGDHRPVGPVRLRAGNPTAEDRDLMPQDQDLHVFGGVAARERPPLYEPAQSIDMTARITRTPVVHGLISEYRRAA